MKLYVRKGKRLFFPKQRLWMIPALLGVIIFLYSMLQPRPYDVDSIQIGVNSRLGSDAENANGNLADAESTNKNLADTESANKNLPDAESANRNLSDSDIAQSSDNEDAASSSDDGDEWLKTMTCEVEVRKAEADGGDCQAFGKQRRPTWACPDNIRRAIRSFEKIYETRPLSANTGGIRFDHAFALWYSTKARGPEFIVESGGGRGQSTWILQQAAPNAKIYSIDPQEPSNRLQGVEYFVGPDFKDISAIDWQSLNMVPEKALVYFDDEQPIMTRLADGIQKGFRHFMFDDNYAFLEGDNYSFKWACERQSLSKWPGQVPAGVNKGSVPKSWEEHWEEGNRLNSVIRSYYEFPPVLSSDFTGSVRYNPKYTSHPLLTSQREVDKYGPTKIDGEEHQLYTHFCVVETHPGAHFSHH